jgi:CRISPR-associated protein Csb2
MEPVRRSRPVHAFTVTGGLLENADPVVIASAMRRALMARVQTVLGRGAVLPAFFSGHGTDGAPARVSDDGAHLAFAFEPETRRVLVIAPHVAEHRVASKGESYHLQTLDRALDGMTELRAGSAGVLSLAPAVWGASPDTLVGVSREWRSVTPYRVTRHAKGLSAVEAFSRDIAAECQRAGLPSPTIDTRDVRGVPGVGLVGLARLTFAVAVEGPIVLGKDRHLGGGLFVATDPR